jgi:hypothetical protein
VQTRNQLAAMDLATGALKPWNPDPGWGQVMCIAADPHAIYVGGRFTDINGTTRQNIAAVDLENGDLMNWNPGVANGEATAVSSLALGGEWVYVGGDFATVGGLPRNFLAAIDTSGRVGPWDPEPASMVTAICPAGASVYLAGAFRQIGGQARSGLAEVDTVLGAPTPWNPGTDETVFALGVAGGVVYAGGQFQELGGAPRASLGAIDRTTGMATSWDPGVGDSPYFGTPYVPALLASDGVLYVAGDFSQAGGKTHFFAAALDTGSARALEWEPDVSAGPLRALIAKDHKVYFGGRLTRYGSNPAGGLGAWPAIEVASVVEDPVAIRACYPNPATRAATLSFVLTTPAQVSLSIFDLQGRRIGQPIANEARPAGTHYANISVEGWSPGCYLCRLEVGGRDFTSKLVVLRE